MNRIEKIKKLCNPELDWSLTRLGLNLEYTGYGEVSITTLDEADYCTPEEAIEALEELIRLIKKHSK